MKNLLLLLFFTFFLQSVALGQQDAWADKLVKTKAKEWNEETVNGNVKSINSKAYSGRASGYYSHTLQKFNQHGKLTEEIIFLEGRISEKTLYTYNSNQLPTKKEHITYSLPDTFTIVYTYNANGLLTKEVSTRKSNANEVHTHTFDYNRNGDLISTSYSMGLSNPSVSKNSYEYTYHANGNITQLVDEHTTHNGKTATNSPPTVAKFVYDNKGRLSKSETLLNGNKANLISSNEFTYDNQNRVVSKVSKYGGTESNISYWFDIKGNMTVLTENKRITRYTYDKEGNWTNSSTGAGNAAHTVIREIEYY